MATLDRFLTRTPSEGNININTNEQPRQQLAIKSRSGFTNYQCCQVYLRIVDKGTFTRVQSVGCQKLNVKLGRVLTADEVSKYIVIKLGKQGWFTGRQEDHDIQFPESTLLDSFPTQYYHKTEDNIKTYYTQRSMLYKGKYDGKATFDTELLLVPRDNAQACYDEIADNFRRIVEQTRLTFETSLIEVKHIDERMLAAAHAHEKEMRLHEKEMRLHEEKMLLIKAILEATCPEDKELFKKELESVNASLRAA